MKHLLFLIIPIIFLSNCVNAQSSTSPVDDCNFFKNLKFKDGVDTVFVLANKNASVKPPPNDANLKKLNSLKKLNDDDYYYCVDFSPMNCSTHFIIQCRDKSDKSFKINAHQAPNKVILKCVFYEGFYESNRPYFVINKIILTN